MREEQIIEEIKIWFRNCLGCVAGKREFSKDRYMFEVVYNSTDIKKSFTSFVNRLTKHQASACLFICPIPEIIRAESVEPVIRYLAEQFAFLNNSNPDVIVNGGSLSFNLKLLCPVCNIELIYIDFDGVAFCPQSDYLSDPLYDPLMSAPYPCVNLNSDIFAFSIYTHEMSINRFSKPVYELDIGDRRKLYELTKKSWQKMAETTISNYINITDIKRCPVHFSEEKNFWYVNHQDPAFAELEKKLYKHEMPNIYVDRICAEWEKYFLHNHVSNFSNVSIPGF